jgi:hypothetical protein
MMAWVLPGLQNKQHEGWIPCLCKMRAQFGMELQDKAGYCPLGRKYQRHTQYSIWAWCFANLQNPDSVLRVSFSKFMCGSIRVHIHSLIDYVFVGSDWFSAR